MTFLFSLATDFHLAFLVLASLTKYNCTFLDESMEHGKMIMETNYLSGCIFTKEVINAMKSKGIEDGHIVNINR